MKIIYTTSESLKGCDEEWSAQIGEELKTRGETKIFLEGRHNVAINPATIFRHIKREFLGYPQYPIRPKQINNRLLKICKEFKPDVLICMKGIPFDPKIIKQIKCKKICINNDDFQHFNEELMREFDFIFTPAEDYIPKYKELGVKSEWMGYACTPAIQKNLNLKKEYNISFVGRTRPEREPYFDKMKKFEKCFLWLNKGGNLLTFKKFTEIMNKSKININMHQELMKIHRTKSNLRVYEVLGCGQFLLTDKAGGMEDLFKENKHMVTYKDADDMEDKIKYWLERDEEREKMGLAAQKEILKKHTIKNRVDQILKVLKKL